MIFKTKIDFLYKDGAEYKQLDFQDAMNPISKQLIFFHDGVIVYFDCNFDGGRLDDFFGNYE